MSPRHPATPRFLAVALLLALAYLQLSTLAVTSPTMDEALHIVRGYAFVARGDDRLRLRGPILPNALSGMSLRLLESDLELAPADDPAWLDSEGAGLSEQFLWSNTVSPQRIVFLARLPIIFVSVLLGAFVFRWASERRGAMPALGALILYVFCPNLLAHARLATTDAVTAATFFISAYAFQRALARPESASRLLSGLALGLALAAKFSSAVLPVAFFIQAALRVWQGRGDRRARPALSGVEGPALRSPRPRAKRGGAGSGVEGRAPIMTLLATAGIGALTLWVIYGLTVGPLQPDGIVLPAPYYWAEWQALFKYVRGDELLPTYLFGQIVQGGWWYYFPIAFLVKTPLAALAMALLALTRTFRARAWTQDLPLWLAPGLLVVTLFFSPQDIGYRYLLPLLPFMFVAGADVIAAASHLRWARAGAAIVLVWHVGGALNIYPYYLAYFNELAGGPDGGRYILSDSNIDWGQDLIGLKHYADRHRVERLKLSYFGVTPPSVYGMQVEALPPVRNAMYDQGAWWLYMYYPPDPPPGIYAISVANLMGGMWIDQETYATFRGRAPDTTIGHSIYIYTIPARGAPVNLSLSGLQVDQIDPDTYRRFGGNDVRLRWFDATQSLIAAPGEAWVAVSEAQAIAPEFAALFDDVAPAARARTVDTQQPYRLYFFDLGERLARAARAAEQTAAWSPEVDLTSGLHTVTLPVKFGETAELLGYRILPRPASGETVVVTTWRAGKQVVTPLQMFVHALDTDGQIAAQEDRLDAPAYGWREGDVIAQLHRLTLPAGRDPVWIEIGFYNIETGERLPVIADGREVDRRLVLKRLGADE